jgi:hypothetical protein
VCVSTVFLILHFDSPRYRFKLQEMRWCERKRGRELAEYRETDRVIVLVSPEWWHTPGANVTWFNTGGRGVPEGLKV